jgi:MarR family transcriptional regulator, organic hydroperoxide resistance regulator
MDRVIETAKLLGEVNIKMRNYMRKSMHHKDLPVAQAIVMGQIYHGKGMKISDLGKILGLSNSTVSGIVDRLEKSNSVIRERSREDRRVVYVSITDKFRKDHESFEASFEKAFTKLLGSADGCELESISTGLGSLKKVLDNMEDKGENRNDQNI